jgi:pyrroloquinoline quinone biosynthesis protein B
MFLAAACAAPREPTAPPEVEAVVLGVLQDGGLPHLGCERACCEAARRDPSRRGRVASLGIVDRLAETTFLIDATPDLPAQVDELNAFAGRASGSLPDGILLTHGHVGHYTGLVHLGREVASARAIPVYCTPSMASFLRENAPWRLLVEAGHVELLEVRPGETADLTPRLRAMAVAVPHRRELSDTVAWRLLGPSKTLLYLPDLDAWKDVEGGAAALFDGIDVALLDGTFFDPRSELPGREPALVPHPPIPQTLSLLATLAHPPRAIFVHLNHSNPALDPASREARAIREAGAEVAVPGLRIPL